MELARVAVMIGLISGWLALMSGCAALGPVRAGEESLPDVAGAGQEVRDLPPDRLQAEYCVTGDRRTYEIPAGFVRGMASGQATAARGAETFDYTPRAISCTEAWNIALTAGNEAGLDPGLLFGIMRVESTFKVNVISYAGAIGLMQVMPGPAARLGCGDLLDPLENARCGAKILSRFLARFDNRIILGLSAYNAGYGMPGRARKKSTVPANFSYPENVLRVRARFHRWGCAPWE